MDPRKTRIRDVKKTGRGDFMTLRRIHYAAFLAMAVAVLPAAAQDSMKAKSNKITDAQSTSVTATVEAVDAAHRELTLKSPKGEVVVVEVPETVKRFSEIKVGDKLKIKYTEALVLELHKADSGAKLGTEYGEQIERSPGAAPAGSVTRKIVATVAVQAMDKSVPSITVQTAKGNTQSFRVQDVKNLENVAVGDKISITYSEAIAVQVVSGAK
jgi:Cu/Ag efflux protein CusF